MRCSKYWFQLWRLRRGLIDGEVIQQWFHLHMIQCQDCREWWADQKRLMDQAVHP